MALIHEIDFGTPAKEGAPVSLMVDGIPITVPEGTSVMRAALEAGVKVPKLCASDNLDAFGSCRICLVEIEGRAGTPASCTTPVAPGMKVTTSNERLRRGVMELYISDHPLDCLICAANGNCELQDTAGEVGLRDVRYGYAGENHLAEAKDTSNPYFDFDLAKCIVCSRCVRACEEVQGTFALTVAGRGFDSRIAASQGQDFLSSECVSCGACVQACPTATLIEKSVVEMGQPEHSVVTTCAYCGVGCQFKAEMRGTELVRTMPYKDGKANHGHSCIKGRFAWGYATHRERILKPMVRAKLIVIDPRRIDLVRTPHIEAAYHLPLRPGTNVAMMTALAHVIVTEDFVDEALVRKRCDWGGFQDWAAFVADPAHSPEATVAVTGVAPELVRGAARLYATGGNGSLFYGLGVTEHSQGTTTVMAIANLAMATGNIGREGVGLNPLRGQNNVQGSCDMGSFHTRCRVTAMSRTMR